MLKQNTRKQGGMDFNFNNGSLMRSYCRGIVVGFRWGPVQITCLGVKRNEFSTRLFATTAKMLLLAPVVHLAIIQACFGLSSRVLLVSYLRRSNRKCTVKRFFKSTVMMRWSAHEQRSNFTGGKTTFALMHEFNANLIQNNFENYYPRLYTFWFRSNNPKFSQVRYYYTSH